MTEASLLDDAMSYVYPAALRTAVLLDIADHLDTGPLPVEELAHKTNTHPEHLHRVLRLLATRDVFCETQPGVFAMTPGAEVLRRTHPMADAVLFVTGPLMWSAIGQLHHSATAGIPAFDHAFGEPFFDYLASHPDDGANFDRGMAAFTDLEVAPIIDTCPLPQEGTVVDVAGGRGGLLLEALRANPKLHGVLFDQDRVLADHLLDTPDVAGRWETRGGDFFEKVPAGDAYLIKRILHDWSDDECVHILRNCAASAKPGAHVFAIDAAIPEGNEPHPGKTLDLFMPALLTGRERTTAELVGLCSTAGLRVDQVVPVPGTTVSIVAAAVAR
ncbi:methyltransferase [Amycolatopsis sp. NBC_01488]|uniref:methyltransferase n=1 Tax=Amycolatopsis sp. NBC_01488 TaxID=2903563 RepID=UPI002E2D42FF|nr:methyltransferase [Amycolatopsis sp. NBC_01488]